MLYRKIAKCILTYSEEECSEELLIYGMEVLWASWIKILFFLLIGICTGFIGENLLILGVFCSLRSQAGGRHCKTSLRCSAAMLIIIYGSILMSSIIELPPLFLVVCLPFYFYILYCYAPLFSRNNETENGKKIKKKKATSFILIAAFTVAAVLVTIPRIRGMIFFAYTAELCTLLPLEEYFSGSLSCCRK